MSVQGKTTSKIYDRFRSSDDQINFLMSEKGEMSLDREIVKMMKQMKVDEIVQFANQFFKFKQNQCSSLQNLISKELEIRKDQSDQCKKNEEFTNEKVQQFEFIDNTKKSRDDDKKVTNLNNLSDILTEMNNIKQALEQDFTSQKNKSQQQPLNNEDKIDFQKYTYQQQYVPKLSNDEDYLIQNNQPQDFVEFDKLPAYLLLPPQQIKQLDQEQISRKNKLNQQRQQQKAQKIESQNTEIKNLQVKNILQMKQSIAEQQQTNEQELQQNSQQVPQQVPTTVQENQQFDFQQIERISLPDNKFKITYNNGDQYEGQLQNQMKNGWGDYHYNTGQRYQGFFIDDQIHGYGQYFFLSGASYQGDWSSGMKHGVGILKFSNGDIYQGQFVKDMFHGKGNYNYANGDVFTGTWKNGQKHGKGKLQTFDGSLQMGNWVNDKFQI